jgi:hypothetical protein
MSDRSLTAHDLLMHQFLGWIGEAGRGYGETMEAWRSSCPRLSVWEDALDAGLVRVARGTPGTADVTLTVAGTAMLAESAATH